MKNIYQPHFKATTAVFPSIVPYIPVSSNVALVGGLSYLTHVQKLMRTDVCLNVTDGFA